MGECPPLLGNVTVFVGFTAAMRKNTYDASLRTLMCYLKTTNYTLLLIDLDKDPRVQRGCGNHSMLFYKKHCAVAMYLPETDWMLVLDADTGVVNPNHCIEEWIDDRVDVLLYERFFNWEVAAEPLENSCTGGDLHYHIQVKNSNFGIKFLREFAKYEFKTPGKSWHGNDQGGLMMLLLKLLVPDATNEFNVCQDYWEKATNYDTYMAAVVCVRAALGAERIWPKKADFMLHGWKGRSVREWDGPFEHDIDPNKCGSGFEGWWWRSEKKKSIEEIRQVNMLEEVEDQYRSDFPDQAKANGRPNQAVV
ncbi:hypothetical protein ANCDUO_04328 [Ancylostoma duodenale]|uniref:Nucleotide-diphospho-sugar transferase domain-containing protein n=1 Tax=Ancylostoma duodenale TaxID=51022 RepID=A0A0C2D6X0_9BILA|nr:hypothetical protein ANCDUO_04328 [Ancylostoma duodenale]